MSDNTGDADLYREVRPSLTEALAAIGWRATGKTRWQHTGQFVREFEEGGIALEANVYTKRQSTTGRLPLIPDVSMDGRIRTERIGGLLFRNGALVKYGRTAKGTAKKPADRPRGEKGAKTAPRNPQRYLSLKGATSSPMAAEGCRTPYSHAQALPDMYDPLPRILPGAVDVNGREDTIGRFGVAEGRALLKAFGVDGSVAFEDLPVPATKCAEFVLSGKQWVGGFTTGKGTGGGEAWDGDGAKLCRAGDVGEAEAERELSRAAEELRARHLLGNAADVLDLAVTAATAETVGLAQGLAPSSARKYGARVIDRALDRLLEVFPLLAPLPAADNDNRPGAEKIAA